MQGAAVDEPLWVFGYGSLVWRTGDLGTAAASGGVCVRGQRRAWWQGSTDHRGTPDAPGRVVTLVPDQQAVTWGRAYRLPPPGAARDAALAYLEQRECQYDIRSRADLFASAAGDEPPVITRALLYVASSDPAQNRNYLGPASTADVAATVAVARGPSGDNCEYVYQLANAMRALGVVDEELYDLEARVRRLRGEDAREAAAGAGLQEMAAPAEAATG